jgi:PPR repeat
VYLSIFLLLKKFNKSPLILNWLELFSSSYDPSTSPSLYPRFHDTLVIGYAVAGKPETALAILGRMRYSGLDLDPLVIRVLLNSLVENSLFSFCDSLLDLLPPNDPEAVPIRLKSLCMQKDLDSAESLLRSLPTEVSARDRCAGLLVNEFSKKGKHEKAWKIVEDFPSGEVYTVWLMCLVKKGKFSEALGFLADKKVTEDYIPPSPV